MSISSGPVDTLAAMAEPNPAIGDDPVVRRFEVNRDCVLRWQAGDLRAVPVEQKLALLRKHLNSLQGVVGVNNHQGSRATSDKATMTTVLSELRSQNLFFLDSRTAASSVGNSIAREMGVPTARNDIFLDNSSDVEAIRAQVYKALALADKNGSVIAICHVASEYGKMLGEVRRRVQENRRDLRAAD